MNEHIIVRTIIRVLVPFILMFGFYIQFHGEYSPGGGFQAGVIWAAAFIVYSLIHGLEDCMSIIPFGLVRFLASFGVLLYAFVGIVAMLKGGEFLNYSVLTKDAVHGQQLGIMIIELGVGITVFSVVMIIFYIFGMRASS